MDQKLKERLLGAGIILSVLVMVLPTLFKQNKAPVVSSNTLGTFEDEADLNLEFEQKPRVRKIIGKPQIVQVPTKPQKIVKAPTKPSSEWVLRMGVFTRQSNARSLIERLSAKGYPAFAKIDNTKEPKITRVLIGPYKNESEVKKIRDSLKKDLKIQGIVLLVDNPESGATT